MTNPQTELPTVEIDAHHWSREKRTLWRAVQTFASETKKIDGEALDLDHDIVPVSIALSYELYPHLSDHDREVLCVEVITQLREAFALVCDEGSMQ